MSEKISAGQRYFYFLLFTMVMFLFGTINTQVDMFTLAWNVTAIVTALVVIDVYFLFVEQKRLSWR